MTVQLNGNAATAPEAATAPPMSLEAQAFDNRSEDVHLPDLEPSKLIVTLTDSPKPIPDPTTLVFGQTMTDHMLIMSFNPASGWTAPVIQPYQPLTLDPASSCFQYCPNVFEGMKAYLGPDGTPRLFRPNLNMKRMQTSVDRVALPTFDTGALLTLIKRLVMVDKRWIPSLPGYSLYIRPTIIGTRPALGVVASTHAMLYVILSPAGPFFTTGPKPISLLAVYENVRSWPGGTGGFKLGLNYAPCFEPQKRAAKQGYHQVLWLLGDERKITEAGAMNFFVVVRRDDGDLDIFTPPLDGTILPGITRNSVLSLAAAHSLATPLPHLNPSTRLHTLERTLTISDLQSFSASGALLESFCVGTAVVVAPVGRIGYEGRDIVLPEHEKGLGPVGGALSERIMAIQEGKFEWEGWSTPCA